MKRLSLTTALILLSMMILCTAALAQPAPYTVELSALTGIYEGPGVNYGYLRPVGEDGVYTIVEEAFDEYGRLWGKLRSGAGWVMPEALPQLSFHELPYTVSLKASDDICQGPGYDDGYVKEIGEDGVYTIVEEAVCTDGFLWGKLKSGAGWVRLPTDYASTYTVSLGAWVPIYSAPGYEDGVCVEIVGEDGVYTIVAELPDADGNVWGRLQSGAGWIDLTAVRTLGNPPLTAYFAEILMPEEEIYQEYAADSSEYAVRIAFRANEPLKNVNLTSLQYDGETYVVDERLYGIDLLPEDAYFVASVVFYGDMTAYGISFADSSGEARKYTVSISGRDGSLVLTEH